MTRAEFKIIPGSGDARLEDHRRYPLCHVMLSCGACAWARGYDPERIIDRLRTLRAGGHRTPVKDIARRVAWPCPACRRLHWAAELAWPPGVTDSQVRRRANLYRN
jgi:hypothetical protein